MGNRIACAVSTVLFLFIGGVAYALAWVGGAGPWASVAIMMATIWAFLAIATIGAVLRPRRSRRMSLLGGLVLQAPVLAGLGVALLGWVAPALLVVAAGASVLAIVACRLIPARIVRRDQVVIRAPQERVFAAIRDPRRALRWSPRPPLTVDLDGEPGAVGSSWRMRYRGGVVSRGTVVASEPPSRIVTRERTSGWWGIIKATSEADKALTTTAEGTEGRMVVEMRLPLLTWFVVLLGRSSLDRTIKETNDRMRAELEASTEVEAKDLPTG